MQHKHAKSFSVDKANKTFLDLFPQQEMKMCDNRTGNVLSQ